MAMRTKLGLRPFLSSAAVAIGEAEVLFESHRRY